MPIAAGQQLLHYRLIDKLGEGGMGVVWKAVDTALGREVAIKVLPPDLSDDAERLARFDREARVLASLKHPNIATIHGLHEVDGTRFIVMELVKGEDLALRLDRGPLPLDEALDVARQIADALEAAHEQGVVHRDLKPANVVFDGNQVQVLDFGLAKALSPESGPGSRSVLPTVTSAQTRDGVILGTAAYMSPEQARGKEVDRRADIWAFGCVLYEALTAKRAYAAETMSDTLVAVLSGEPDWSALPGVTPPEVRRLLQRCLEKDARRRLRDIGEARVALEDAIAAGPAPSAADAATESTVGRRRSPFVRVWPVLAIGLAFVAGWFLGPGAPTETVQPERSIRQLTFEPGLEEGPSVSPDGNYIAYSTNRAGNLDIEILPLAGGSVSRIVSHPADDAHPSWSPDGTQLAFVSARDHQGPALGARPRTGGLLVMAGRVASLSVFVTSVGGDIFLVPARGGVATKLIEDAAYPTWSPDGNSIAFQSERDGNWRIWRVPTTGGEPVQLTAGDRPGFDFHPAWSPDGRYIAYASLEPGAAQGIFVVPAEGGEPIQVYDGAAASPAWSPDGKRLFFGADRTAAAGILNLWSTAFDPTGKAGQRLERVTFGTGSDFGPSPSADGRKLAFAQVSNTSGLWKLEVATGNLSPVIATEASEYNPHLHPDGRRLLFGSDRTGSDELWVLDLDSGELEPVVTKGEARNGRWSPDGNSFSYVTDTDPENRNETGAGPVVVVQHWGSATREVLGPSTSGVSRSPEWSPDGRRIVAPNDGALWIYEPGGEARLLVRDASDGTWSPDGSEIAFQRETPGNHRELWVVPAAGGEPRRIAGGEIHYSHPAWRPGHPDEILVVIDHLELGIVHAGTGEVERLTDVASSTFQVDFPCWSPDGKTIYLPVLERRGDILLIEQ